MSFEPDPTIINPPEIAGRQIVSPPAKTEPPPSVPVEPPRHLSDQDNFTNKEQIQRGDAPDAGPSTGKPAPPAAAMKSVNRPVEKPQQQKVSPPKQAAVEKEMPRSHNEPLKDLLLDDKTLFAKFSEGQAAPRADTKANETALAEPISQPFSRPAGSGAAFIGLRGSSDYLPNLPDGDITLLNTKADKFAVFVRRVATNVFGQIRQSGWETMSPGDVRRIGEFASVRAVLSPKGELLRVSLETSSGSKRFDEVLVSAVKAGARDPNPPVAAKSDDGNFHFIFRSKCWTQFGSSARTGALRERRWLQLATGLL